MRSPRSLAFALTIHREAPFTLRPHLNPES